MNFDIAGVWGLALLALPMVVLLLAALAYARAESMANARPLPPQLPREPVLGPAAPAPLAAARPVPERSPPAGASLRADRQATAVPEPPPRLRAEPQPPLPANGPRAVLQTQRALPVTTARPLPPIAELPRPPFPKAAPTAAALAKQLADAEAGGKSDAVADLKVALGMARFREGATSTAAADDVRSGLIMAMQQNRALAQAHARLALGDLCKAGGDPTTACEHWQLARDIFAKAGEAEHRKAAETRMRANGCPTDWVLNDF